MGATFGHRLRQLRQRRGLSQQALATRVGVPRHTITRLEAEKLDPRAGLVQALEQALEGDPGSLLYDQSVPRLPEGVLDIRPVLTGCSLEGRKLMAELLLSLVTLLTRPAPARGHGL